LKTEINRKGRSKELSSTLELLENAIRDWDGIVIDPLETNKPKELTQRTQGLLKQLRQQIDELSG
jgi:chemotaxis regulatin CheY-phosphate phosphatase CheZ